MLKTKLSGLICQELSEMIEEVFEVKTTVVENGTHTVLEPSIELSELDDVSISIAICFFEGGHMALKSALDEIQEHSQMITAKINQI